jgi:hypothetical protein
MYLHHVLVAQCLVYFHLAAGGGEEVLQMGAYFKWGPGRERIFQNLGVRGLHVPTGFTKLMDSSGRSIRKKAESRKGKAEATMTAGLQEEEGDRVDTTLEGGVYPWC